jgi:hypothetical protein
MSMASLSLFHRCPESFELGPKGGIIHARTDLDDQSAKNIRVLLGPDVYVTPEGAFQ